MASAEKSVADLVLPFLFGKEGLEGEKAKK